MTLSYTSVPRPYETRSLWAFWLSLGAFLVPLADIPAIICGVSAIRGQRHDGFGPSGYAIAAVVLSGLRLLGATILLLAVAARTAL